ncbi:hypothetical protein [Variovorax sp. OV084]|uniref:hypothetical protein n=1 Tax=Variovorax sp. OV084 TaxID=1882777 RepID=UPI0008CA2263|nr:hypothetical protein [Variovorax sp. OV084]SEU17059.1 hypothetical protein SAMN05443580_12085 [Variovorax sp. OV084]
MPQSHNPEIIAFIDVLADTGSHYRMDEMEALYTEDLGFLVLTPQGEVARFSKSEMMAEFRSVAMQAKRRCRRKSGSCTSRSRAMKPPRSSFGA